MDLPRGVRASDSADRAADIQREVVRAGPVWGAVAARGGGRALHRRRRGRPGLLESPGADGGTVRARPVPRNARGADVPDGGSGPLPAGWKPGVLGTQ